MENHEFTVAVLTFFAKKHARNHKYSIRSFAKLIGISHVHFLRILKNKTRLTPKVRAIIETKLREVGLYEEVFKEGPTYEFTKPQAEYFMNPKVRAISSLLVHPKCLGTISWFKKMTNLPEKEIQSTLERLAREGLITKVREGKFAPRFSSFVFPEESVKEGFVTSLQQTLELIKSDQDEVGSYQGISLGFDAAHSKKVKEVLRDTVRKLQLMSRNSKDHKYFVEISMIATLVKI